MRCNSIAFGILTRRTEREEKRWHYNALENFIILCRARPAPLDSELFAKLVHQLVGDDGADCRNRLEAVEAPLCASPPAVPPAPAMLRA